MGEVLTIVPDMVNDCWDAYGAPVEIARVREMSAEVSTNRVYRLELVDGSSVFAKVSTYGSFVHFRQDHQRIHRWCQLLEKTRFGRLMARVLCRDDEPFLYREGHAWAVLYEEVPVREMLPPILGEPDIVALGHETAALHAACESFASELPPTWKTLGSDIAQLSEQLDRVQWCEERGMTSVTASFVRVHCDAFLTNADTLGYHSWAKIPVLVDWNIGNFSIERPEPGQGGDAFRLFSRWDYDWLRIEPAVLDFYFLSRVVSSVGDRTTFSYGVEPLLEPRFQLFLQAYHEVRPLDPGEIMFLKEVYRFFLLNYVIREGEFFFRPEICGRLRREILEIHLPELEQARFDSLLRSLGL